MGNRKPKTYIVPGFHSDVVWLEDQRDYAKVLTRDLEQNLLVARDDASYGFFVHELSYLKPYLDVNPDARKELKRLIAEERVGTGGTHSQPAETLIGGEALIRNIVYGRLYHERVLGDRPEVLMAWDVFGHCAQLAQICAKSRFVGAIWSKAIRGAMSVFLHEAPDGTKLLFKRTNYSFGGMGIRAYEDFHKMMKAAFGGIKALGFRTDVRLDCVDFKPPTDWMVGRSGELSSAGHEIVVTGRGHELWFREALEDIAKKRARVPVIARDFEFYHQGTGVSRIELKLANRLAECLLTNAEKFAAIAWLHGAEYPDGALDKAWRHVLFSQHHDVITGASCDRGYLDVMAGYREACELAHDVYERSTRAVAEIVDTAKDAPKGSAIAVVVFNPLNWRRTEAVRAKLEFGGRKWRGFRVVDAKGKDVLCELEEAETNDRGHLRSCEVTLLVEDAPSLGYETLYAVRAARLPEGREKARGNTIENEFFSVTADAEVGGGITSIYDKRSERELVDAEIGPANELVSLEEEPWIMEPSWELWTKGPKYFSREYVGVVEVWKGPVSERLVVKGEMKDCRRRQEVVLYRGVRRIDFVTKLEGYSGIDHLHVVTFPVKLKGLQPIFDERFATTVKRPSKGKLDFRTQQPENFSDCGVRHGNQWVGLSSSAMLRFGEKKAYSLGMVNIVHSSDEAGVEAAGILQSALIGLGVPVDPWHHDLEWEKRKKFGFSTTILPQPDDFYADLPYGTSFRVSIDVGGGNSYSKKLLSQLPGGARRKFENELEKKGTAYLFMRDKDTPSDWEPLPVLLISAKSGKEMLRAAKGMAKEFVANAEAHLPEEADVSGMDGVVDDYGFAILNLGHVTASVENDSTMVLFLMRTARWGISPWGKDRLPFFLLPEHRTHVYRYAVYPHEGDWRGARTYRSAREFNNPLKAVCTGIHSGKLNGKTEFVSSDIASFVVTALKPHGYATAGFAPEGLDRKRGLTIRGYEASGRRAGGELRFWRGLRAAHRTNLLEERERAAELSRRNSVKVSLRPFEIETLQVIPTRPASALRGRELGRSAEPLEVVHFKQWDHNLGAAPIGYGAVAVSLCGNVSLDNPVKQGGVTVNDLGVVVTNNYVDKEVEGDVEFLVPPGWRVYPEKVHYRLRAGEGKKYRALVVTPLREGVKEGLIKARIEEGGQTFQDVMEVGEVPPLRWEVFNTISNMGVRIQNNWVQSIEGEVDLISPMETWGKELVGEQFVVGFGPLRQYFEVPPGGSAEVAFEIRPEMQPRGASRHFLMKSVWAVAKLAYNGKVDYKPIPYTSVPADEPKLIM